jgi:uncharacterized protein (DUF736 family)
MADKRDNSFILFQELEKRNDKSPDYRGNIIVNGEEFELAAWDGVAKNGNKYVSGRVSKKGQYARRGNGENADPF